MATSCEFESRSGHSPLKTNDKRPPIWRPFLMPGKGPVAIPPSACSPSRSKQACLMGHPAGKYVDTGTELRYNGILPKWDEEYSPGMRYDTDNWLPDHRSKGTYHSSPRNARRSRLVVRYAIACGSIGQWNL